MTLPTGEFFQGGLMLMIIGGLLAYARQLPMQAFRWLRDRSLTTLRINDNEQAFTWVRLWLSDQLKNRRVRHARLYVDNENKSGPVLISQARRDTPKPAMRLVPGDGMFLIRFGGRQVLAHIERQDVKVGNSDVIMFERASINLTAWGRASVVLAELAAAAYDYANAQRVRQIMVWLPQYGNWIDDVRMPRPPESLVFDAGLFERVDADLTRFCAAKDWYVRMGIPYRRGYLLKGPPGNGKTSLVTALAGKYSRDVRFLSLASIPDDSRLLDLLAQVPAGDILLLEDVDVAFDGRERAKDSKSELTFSGLLNALDGLVAREDRVLFMTTNHPERLDPALIRRGRIDVEFEIGNASQDQCRRMFERFFVDESGLARKFAEAFDDQQVSMASVQEILMANRDNPVAAVAAAIAMSDSDVEEAVAA